MFAKLKEKAKQLKKEVQILQIAYNDKRTPILAKILIIVTIGYALSPIDIIPDFIPFFGILDDLLLIPILISISIKLIPDQVIEEARQKCEITPLKKVWWGTLFVIAIWIFAIALIWKVFDFEKLIK